MEEFTMANPKKLLLNFRCKEFILQMAMKHICLRAIILLTYTIQERMKLREIACLLPVSLAVDHRKIQLFTIAYKFAFDQDKLIMNGILPNGMIIEEYWKRVK
jgi:hypothetical protein